MSDARRTSALTSSSSPVRNRIRSAALVASLVPLASVAASPVTVSAQCSGCPPPVPEPSTLALLVPAAAALIIRRRMKK